MKNQAQRYPARGVQCAPLDPSIAWRSTSRPTGSSSRNIWADADRTDRAQRRHGGCDVVTLSNKKDYDFAYSHDIPIHPQGVSIHVHLPLGSREGCAARRRYLLENGVTDREQGRHKHGHPADILPLFLRARRQPRRSRPRRRPLILRARLEDDRVEGKSRKRAGIGAEGRSSRFIPTGRPPVGG